jgi:Family of unknown function (DUF5338)
MKRLHWGQGRIKVLAVRPEIEKLLLEGQPIATIYATLTEAGKIDVAKRTFERHASAIQYYLKKRSAFYGAGTTPPAAAHPSPKSSEKTKKSALPSKFSHKSTPSDDPSDW